MTIINGEQLVRQFSLDLDGHAPRLFHGTGEPMVGHPRPGSYDQVLWSAETSAIAQSYIPAAGSQTLLSIPGYALDESVCPSRSSAATDLVRQMGFEPLEVAWDANGIARSWHLPQGYPTNRELVEFIEKTLGYQTTEPLSGGLDRRYWLKMGPWNKDRQQADVMPAAHKAPGTLLLLQGFEDMRFLNISTGDPDLTNLQSHRLRTFEQARAAGLDGVVIDDFCQTINWGNVGHTSIGFFAPSAARLQVLQIPAVRFDFEDKAQGLQVRNTPEYSQFLLAESAARRDLVAAAVASQGEGVGPGSAQPEMGADVANLLRAVKAARAKEAQGAASDVDAVEPSTDSASQRVERQR